MGPAQSPGARRSPASPERGSSAERRPVLVGAAVAVPDVQLGPGATPVGVVEALAGLRVVQGAPGPLYPRLRSGVVAAVQVDGGPVRGTARVDVQAQVGE